MLHVQVMSTDPGNSAGLYLSVTGHEYHSEKIYRFFISDIFLHCETCKRTSDFFAVKIRISWIGVIDFTFYYNMFFGFYFPEIIPFIE